jgi:SAM-dependent methyltransferase
MGTDIRHEIYEGLGEASSIGLNFTRKAFQMLPKLDRPRILDVGCGQGRATLELARLSGGQVVGLDIDQAALEVLSRKIDEEGLSDRVRIVHGSMFDLDFPDESFDVLWAEGALNVIGFESGLRGWHRLIKPGGFLVVHEGVWLQPDPPQAGSRSFPRSTPYPATWHNSHASATSLSVIFPCQRIFGGSTTTHASTSESGGCDRPMPLTRPVRRSSTRNSARLICIGSIASGTAPPSS